MKIDLAVGVWLPNGDEPLVLHLEGDLGGGRAPNVRHITPPASGALILDLRGAERALGWVRATKRG